MNTLATAHTATASNTVLRNTVRENQLDALIEDEVRGLRETILAESERYNKIVKDWVKKKPLYERQIQQLNDKILSLRQQIEDLIIERIGDREHAQVTTI